MPKFGRRSKEKLDTLHPDLQDLLAEIIKSLDITIIHGRRTADEQDRLYEQGYSKLKFPESKHNTSPSKAVDIAIWHNKSPHIEWDDREEFIYLYGYIKSMADKMGISIRAGADWNGDLDFTERFFDCCHFELVDRDD